MRLVAVIQEPGVVAVHAQSRVGVLEDPGDETEMVGVQVGDEHVGDVGQVMARGMDAGDQRVPRFVGVPAGVDQARPPAEVTSAYTRM